MTSFEYMPKTIKTRGNSLGKWKPVRDGLVSVGWKTPDTYGNEFAPLENIPAVYLLWGSRDFQEWVIGYAGMSTQLANRIASHSIRRKMGKSGFWVSCWFMPTPAGLLRQVEREIIFAFNPPWNIALRQKDEVTL